MPYSLDEVEVGAADSVMLGQNKSMEKERERVNTEMGKNNRKQKNSLKNS